MKDAILDYIRESCLPAGWAWASPPQYLITNLLIVVASVREPGGEEHPIYVDLSQARLASYSEWLRQTVDLKCLYALETCYPTPAPPEPKMSFHGRNPLLGEQSHGDDEPVY